MNTRLQVEHPVTEEITGVDLMEWQLRVASGEALPVKQEDLKINGWAMEARLYAEDPSTGFLPSTGPLRHFSPSGVRVETGVEQGDEISPYYDPMIAKLVAHADTRGDAIADLNALCRTTDVWPVKTNAGFLTRLLEAPAFAAGTVDTNFIAVNLEALVEKPPLSEDAVDAAVHLLVDTRAPAQQGFRMNAQSRNDVILSVDGEPVSVVIPTDWNTHANYLNRACFDRGDLIKFDQGYAYRVELYRPRGSHGGAASDGTILSPMPGRIIAVEVAAGDTVTRGQKLLTLEAMKMEHSLTAPFDGVVAEVNAATGGQVSEGMILVRVEEAQ
jgi:3-methylcrotonyl-CoA carboxylase alpha subunit